MTKFLVLEYQEGGCDYTIGCGFRVSVLTAKDRDDAVKKLLKETDDSLTLDKLFEEQYGSGSNYVDVVGYFESEGGPSQVYLVEASKMECLNAVIVKEKARRLHIKLEEKKAKTEVAEKVEYERLQKKFGK